MAETRERRLPLEGAYNFRDLGGYPAQDGKTTRWGRIYRSGALHRLTDADITRLEALGVRTVYDLRSALEHERDPGRLLDRPDIRHFHNPVPNSADPHDAAAWKGFRMAVRYREILDKGHAIFRQIFELLADEANYPFVYHCAGGKDRAGITSAVILRTVGVPDATIIEDYALTGTYYAPRRERAYQSLLERGHDPETIPEILDSDPAWLAAALDHLDATHGGAAAYLREAGVPAQHLEALRHHFLE